MVYLLVLFLLLMWFTIMKNDDVVGRGVNAAVFVQVLACCVALPALYAFVALSLGAWLMLVATLGTLCVACCFVWRRVLEELCSYTKIPR